VHNVTKVGADMLYKLACGEFQRFDKCEPQPYLERHSVEQVSLGWDWYTPKSTKLMEDLPGIYEMTDPSNIY